MDKYEDINQLKSQITSLIKNKACHDEQIDFYNKQIESFQIVKKELNFQINILNDELNKNKSINEKYFDIERENRKLLEHISGLIFIYLFFYLTS